MIKKSKYLLAILCLCFPEIVYCFENNLQKQHTQKWNTKLSASFTENKGQVTDQDGKLRSDVKYIYAAPGMKVIFKANSFSYEVYTIKKNQNISEATGKSANQEFLKDKNQEPEEVTIRTHRIDVNLTGANRNTQIIVQGKSQIYNNYYLAHTPENGIQKVYSYNQLTYKNIWPNIDLVFYAKKEGELKYDIILHPGADIKDVQFAYAGAENIKLINGKLNLQTTLGNIEESIPLSYLAESKEKVNIEYTKVDNNVSFTGKYDKHKKLVIDPAIIWATYFGGNEAENSQSVSTDNLGNIYLSGNTYSTSNISTTGTYQTTHNGNSDVYLVKFNAKGVRKWGTYFGGSDLDKNYSIAIDSSSGNIYLTGETFSTSSIATSGAFQEKKGNFRDAYLSKFDSSGNRIWATYIGGNGNENANAVAVDIYSNILITGKTSSFTAIATTGSHQSINNNVDAFLIQFDSSGQKLWGTYYGGSGNETGYAVTSDKAGNIYIGGQTQSYTDIVTPGAYQTVFGGAFLAKFDNNGKRIWATYYGKNGNDVIKSITTDKENNIYFCGITYSTSSIASKNAYQTDFGGFFNDAFIAKFDSSGNRKWGSYFGGNGEEIANSVITDLYGNVFITGHTNSTLGIATTGAYQDSLKGDLDLFLAKFNGSGKRIWATYYGGTGNDQTYFNNITLDNSFNIYLSGHTTSSSLISLNAVHQSAYGGNADVFLVKLYDQYPDAGILSIDSPQTINCGNRRKYIYFTLKNYSEISTLDSVLVGWSVNGILQIPIKYYPLLKAKETSFSMKIDAFIFNEGINNLKVWTYYPNKYENDIINSNDTFFKEITFYEQPKADFNISNICENSTVIINESSKINKDTIVSYFWDFGDGDTSTKQSPVKKYDSSGTYTIKLIVTSNNGCTDSVNKKITIYPLPDLFIMKTVSERNVKFVVSDSSYASYNWDFGDGDSSNAKNPLHRYPAVGTYKVRLQVTNQYGCETLFTDSVQITTNSIAPDNEKSFSVNIYPNPFEESFILEYTLAKTSSIIAGIYDITGRKVLTISNNTIKQPGKYTQTINTNEHNLKPGIYMLRIMMNGQAITKQLIRVE